MVLVSIGMSSCIEDSFTTSASDQPTFSTDTVRMGELFTLDPSPTQRFIVYNRHSKGLSISRIAFSDDSRNCFRLNVDGMSGSEFNNIEIRAKDSIFIFVEATIPENGANNPVDILAHIEFLTNGVSSKMPVKVTAQDAVRLRGDVRYSADTSLNPDKPIHVFDSLVVEDGATLTLPAGTGLYFHDDARIVVHGTLHVDGSPEKPVNMTGHRTGFVAADIPYEIMSGQWKGIEFTQTSRANRIAHASIRNTTTGLTITEASSNEDGIPALTLINSQVRNSQGYIIDAIHSDIFAAGCELADASEGILHLVGGNHTFNHCTIANYYLFTALGGPAVQFSHINGDTDDESGLPYLTADFSNTIIYGNGTELSLGDLKDTGVYLRRCLLKSKGENDEHFLNCLWDTDPMYFTEREEYIFDYRLRPESPAIGQGYPELTMPETSVDFYGTPRNASAPSLGAFEVSNN